MVRKKILIAFEKSGIIRDAFTALGFDAVSCDLLPSHSPGKHIIDNVLNIDKSDYILAICHPPCTYLAFSGNAYWTDPIRTELRTEAANVFMKSYNFDIPHVLVENPQGIMSKFFRNPDQVIHPYYFGDPHLKRTHFWLKNLPTLQYSFSDSLFYFKTSCNKPEPISIEPSGKRRHYTDSKSYRSFSDPRSKTFPSVARAISVQYGLFLHSTYPGEFSFFMNNDLPELFGS